jgi:hypothetical protein
VLEALDGAMAGANPLPRAELDRMISGLGKRVFLMHNVHRGAPSLMTTRWAMSYLAGPLTLNQIRALEGERKAESPGQADAATAHPAVAGVAAAASVPVAAPLAAVTAAGTATTTTSSGSGQFSRPILPTSIRQFFVPPIARAEGMVYRPAILAAAEVRYSSAKHGIEETRPVRVLTYLEDGPIPLSTDRAVPTDLDFDLLDPEPVDGASFQTLPADAAQPKSYDRWGKEIVRWIPGEFAITIFESKAHRTFSRPGETEREFRMRLADLGRESRDAASEKLRQKYEPRFRTLQERLRKAEQAVEKRAAQSKQAMLNSGLSAIGAVLGAASGSQRGGAKGGILGAFLGAGATRATTAVRQAGRAAQTRKDVAHAEETVEAVQAQIEALEAEFQEELRRIEVAADAEEPLTEVVIRPPMNAVTPRLTALVWLPWGVAPSGESVPLWR